MPAGHDLLPQRGSEGAVREPVHPSTLTWTERRIGVRQVTDFPYADTTTLIITGSGWFDVKVRVPGWVTRGSS